MEFEARADAVADALRGTCMPLERYTTPDERNSIRFCAALDSRVFICSVCNWWCDTEEQNDVDGEWVCDGCRST